MEKNTRRPTPGLHSFKWTAPATPAQRREDAAKAIYNTNTVHARQISSKAPWRHLMWVGFSLLATIWACIVVGFSNYEVKRDSVMILQNIIAFAPFCLVLLGMSENQISAYLARRHNRIEYSKYIAAVAIAD